MGIRSVKNWSGAIVDGVTLGEPAVNEVSGEMHWDGGVPNGVLDAVGLFLEDGLDDNGKVKVKYDLESVYDVKYKSADVKVKVELVETPPGSGVFVPVETVEPWLKGEIVEFEGVVYEASKDTLNPPPHKDWTVIKSKADKVK